ncbi:MAG: hypothetical protein ACRKGH_06920 [Dehalogenimonas sp.]
MLKQATLKDFNNIAYNATIQISGSAQSYLEGVAVAQNIPAAEMIPGRNLAVLFFDRYQAAEAVIITVW